MSTCHFHEAYRRVENLARIGIRANPGAEVSEFFATILMAACAGARKHSCPECDEYDALLAASLDRKCGIKPTKIVPARSTKGQHVRKILYAIALFCAIIVPAFCQDPSETRGPGPPSAQNPVPDCVQFKRYRDALTGDVWSSSGLPCTWVKPGGGGGGSSPGGSVKSIQGNNGIGGLNGGPATVDATTGAVNASVNSQSNVLMFGAKGDCVTDDHNAIIAAQAAAAAMGTGANLPGVVYFPKPPGGCYLTSTIQWQGVSFIGQPSGQGVNAPHNYNVTIKGMPGQDILHAGDPMFTNNAWNNSWAIKDISFLVDDTVAGNFPHRWPGRWFDDGAMTASSATFTSARADIGCSDVGQQIVVGGAGATVTTTTLGAAITTTTQTAITIAGTTSSSWPTIFGYLKIDSEIVMYVGTQANGLSALTVIRGQAGTTAAAHSNGATVTVMGNLATTIASVSPCWAVGSNASTWKTVTLAAAATTTVATAHSYISVLDLPVASNIGSCAMAFDNMDGLSSDWAFPSSNTGSLFSHIDGVTFNTVGGALLNGNCGIFSQGSWIFYGLTVDHASFYSEDFSIVQGTSELNSWNGGFGDFQDWNHLNFVTVRKPAIFYNGGECKFKNVEVTALSGPQFLSLGNAFADVSGWDIEMQEIETWSLPDDTRYGLRVTGNGSHVTGSMSISADSGNHGWIDGVGITCPIGCFADAGGVNTYGFGNSIQTSIGTPVNDQGKGDTITNWYNASYPSGIPAPRINTTIPQKGQPGIMSAYEPDFAADGYPATPYRHEDLFLWPSDIFIGTAGVTPWTTLQQYDTNSLTGEELFIHTGANYGAFWPFEYSNKANPGNLTIGTNFPAAKGTAYFSLLCPTATTTKPMISTSNGTDYPLVVSCSTSLQTYAVPFDFTSATGNILIGNNSIVSGQDFWLAWVYIDIAPQLPAGTTIGGQVPATQLGPTSGTASGDLPCFTNTTGSFASCTAGHTSAQIGPTSSGFTLNFNATGTQVNLKSSTNGNVDGFDWTVNGTDLWLFGTYNQGNSMLFYDRSTTHEPFVLPQGMPSNSYFGNANGASFLTINTNTNCSSSASPAVCAAAPSGSVVVATAATTVQVNTTAVTASSQIQLTFDATLSTKLGVTCNTTYAAPWVSARTAATSFTITVGAAPTTNPACFSYTIVN